MGVQGDSDCYGVVGLVHAYTSTIDRLKIKFAGLHHCYLCTIETTLNAI